MAVEEVSNITERMRGEWDRRVAHDYRFWMGDGIASDEEMWRTGQRDLDLLLQGIDDTAPFTALDLGCGVGRLLRSAAQRFQKVYGFDVSNEALTSAERFLSSCNNVSLFLGDGTSFGGIADNSIDLVYSFASIASLPSEVFARYLGEIARVLRVHGRARLQLFLGKENLPPKEDTLAVRCYERLRFENALRCVGLELVDAWELILPFEISDHESGIVAMIADIRVSERVSASIDEILHALISAPEPTAGEEWIGSLTEYEMALSRAEQHLSRGDKEGARKALEFAVQNFRNVEPEILELLETLRQQTWASVTPVQEPAFSVTENIERLMGRFPETASFMREEPSPAVGVMTARSGETILTYNGTPLDNPEKPRRAAQLWVEQYLAAPRIRESKSMIVFGAGTGYHLEELVKRYEGKIYLVEPRPDVLRCLVRARPIGDVLGRLASIVTSERGMTELLEGKGELPELLIHPQSQIVSRDALDLLKSRLYAKRGRLELRPAFGVVGPIYGGTLPVTHSVTRALLAMKQRVRCFDMSPFHQNFMGLNGFVRDRKRVDQLQNHYVETLSQIVLESVAERPVDILICLAQAPLTPRALIELRNRGIITVMWFVEDCRRFTGWKHLAQYFDYFFIIQKGEFPTLVRNAGAGRAIYLPVGCDPFVHQPMQSVDEPGRWGSEVSFVGAGYNNRQQMFASLSHRDFKIWGTEWPTLPPFDRLVQERGRRLAPEEYVKIFNATKVNLNLHSSSERDGVEPNGDFVNPRTFELAACEAFQLVDTRTLLPEMFDIGKEMVTFESLRELEEKIDFYLAHPAERAKVAKASRERALRDHTYEKRLESMLGYIYADRFEELKAKEQESPWTRTLNAAKRYPELEKRLQSVYERGEDPRFIAMISEIQQQKGKLSETEMKLLFLWHVRQSVETMTETRAGRG